VSLGPDDAKQLVQGLVGPIHHVAERAAVAHDRVEPRVWEPGQVDDVRDRSVFDACFQPLLGEVPSMKVHLHGGDVDRGDPRPEARELDREAARAHSSSPNAS
jgi:hypothetical protein